MHGSDQLRRVIGFAHRGARAHAPENTIEAFVTALRMGATALETDVWSTRDGEVVIDHDGVVGRVGFRRPIATVDVADLDAHIPTLREVQQVIGDGTDLSIDVKDPAAIDAIVSVRRAGGAEALARTWLCDSDPVRVAGWRALDSRVRLVASLRRRDLAATPPQALADLGIDVLNMRHHAWSPALVESCHGVGLAAFAWDVQRVARMRRLIGWGIDGIYSDHTDRMVQTLAP